MFHRQTRTTHINNIGTQLIIPLHCGTKKCRIIARLCTERTSTLCHFGWAAPRSNREIQQYKKTQYKGIHLEDDKRRKSRYMTNGHDWVSRNRQEQNRLFALFLDNGNSTGFDPREATTKTKFAARRTAITHTWLSKNFAASQQFAENTY